MKSVNQYVMKDSGVQWIGEVPEHWEVCKIKNKFMIISGGTPKSDVESYWNGDVIWVTPADYNTEDKVIIKGKRNITEEGLKNSSATILPKNSIVFSKRAPIGLVAINAVPLATNQGCLGCIPKLNVDTIYSYFLLSSFQKQFELLGSGTTFKEISLSSFSSFVIPLPPLSEQRAIADWLDAKCADIDAAIELQQRMIDKLKAYKTAVIHQAVTKGLDKNTNLKDSGVQWIGEVPEHWEVCKIKQIFKERSEKGYPELPVLSATQKYGVIPQSHYENSVVLVNKGLENLKLVRKGDFVISLRSFQGGIEYAHYDGIISAAYTILKLKGNCADYIRLVMKSERFIQLLQSCTVGIREGKNVNYNIVRDNYIFLPPLSEQRAIADWLDAKCADIDATIALKEQKQEKLKAYKKTIIFEYVTGKKQVANINKQL